MRLARGMRHIVLGVIATSTTLALALVLPTDFKPRAIAVASAFSALGFLSVAMLIGPLAVLTTGRSSRHIVWRRDVGIWGGLLSLFHVLVGLRVHFSGDFTQYFFFPGETGLAAVRLDTIGWANYLGLLSTALVVLLLGTSSDAAMKRLGAARWKRLQRSIYLMFALMAVHGVIYQTLTNRPWPAVALLWAAIATVVTLQILGFFMVRRTRSASDPQ